MNSIKKLVNHVNTIMTDFPSLTSKKRVWFCTGEKVKLNVENSVNVTNFDALVKEVVEVTEK